jgi:hypothetical protein
MKTLETKCGHCNEVLTFTRQEIGEVKKCKCGKDVELLPIKKQWPSDKQVWPLLVFVLCLGNVAYKVYQLGYNKPLLGFIEQCTTPEAIVIILGCVIWYFAVGGKKLN